MVFIMNGKISVVVKSLVLSFIFSSFALASGGYSAPSTPSISTPSRAAPSRVDQDYELGKSIYLGRQAGVAKIDYCVEVEGKPVSIKTSSIKNFKRTSYSSFSESLVNCDKPDTLASQELDSDSLFSVMYYLSKRYDLYLNNG